MSAPEPTPGVREVLDAFAAYLAEIVGMDREQVVDRQAVAAMLVADIRHAYSDIIRQSEEYLP